MAALRVARERWAPLAALANENRHHDRRARSIAEVAAAALVDLDAAMQDRREADNRARAKIRRHFGYELDLGACASSLAPRLQVWLPAIPPAILQSLLLEAIDPMKKIALAHAIAVLKTWCNDWPTSQCVACGRRRGDELRHALRCRMVWRDISRRLEIGRP